MKRRTLVRAVSFPVFFSLTFAVLFLRADYQKRKYASELKNESSFTYETLESSVNNIADTLEKARFVTTPTQMVNMASRLLTEAEVSKNALSRMPAGSELENLNRFLSQIGNYAMSLSRRMASDGALDTSDTANIEKLNTLAKKVSVAVEGAGKKYADEEELEKSVEQILSASDTSDISETFGEIEDEFGDYPTLIYDGPYSDHIMEKQSELLKNAKEVTESSAKEVAAKGCGASTGDMKLADICGGKIPTYNFSGAGAYVGVTKKGGYLLFMRKDREISDMLLTNEQAAQKAKLYLENMGLNGFKETYYYSSDGVCTFNFAYCDGKTVCYTDLVKVGVAQDNGEIVFFEGGGYIVNHTDRAFPEPEYTAEEAQKKISPKLEVQKVQLALIPTDAVKNERCYEFTCTAADGTDVLVYINTATLSEDEILILLKSDGGTLVK